MGWIGAFLFGEEDEIKVKELQEIFDIKDHEKAKELYIEIKTHLENKED